MPEPLLIANSGKIPLAVSPALANRHDLIGGGKRR